MPPFAKIKSAVKTACAKAVKIVRRTLVSKPFAAFCAGALTVLALPPYHIFPALLGFTALGFLLAGDMTKKRAFGLGFSFGFAHFGFGLMWVGNALKLDPRFAPVAFLPFFAFGLWGAFFPAFCALTARVLAPSGWRRAVVFAAGWGFFRVGQKLGADGLPVEFDGKRVHGRTADAANGVAVRFVRIGRHDCAGVFFARRRASF